VEVTATLGLLIWAAVICDGPPLGVTPSGYCMNDSELKVTLGEERQVDVLFGWEYAPPF
jgi:hypothetical protein